MMAKKKAVPKNPARKFTPLEQMENLKEEADDTYNDKRTAANLRQRHLFWALNILAKQQDRILKLLQPK